MQDHTEIGRYLFSGALCWAFFYTMYVMVRHADY